MDKKSFMKYVKDFPDDYDFVLGEYVTDFGEDENGEGYMLIHDIPIVGVISDDETKEIRFICSSSSKKILDEIEEKNKI